MDAERIVKISPDSIRELIDSHQVKAVPKQANKLRREERWPFPGTVEVWLPEQCYGDRHVLATLHNLSPHGLAMRSRRPMDRDLKIALAIHQPELSCYGNAVIRHCTRAAAGYLIGIEFIFETEETAEG